MKLTYWTAENKVDGECYSIVSKTKKGASDQLDGVQYPNDYGPIHKRTIEYNDAFDLMSQLTCESGGRVYSGVMANGDPMIYEFDSLTELNGKR